MSKGGGILFCTGRWVGRMARCRLRLKTGIILGLHEEALIFAGYGVACWESGRWRGGDIQY